MCKLRVVPTGTWAVIRYSGTWSRSNYLEHLDKLKAALQAAGVTTQGEPLLARYNAPFTPRFMRRNEIWLALRDAASWTRRCPFFWTLGAAHELNRAQFDCRGAGRPTRVRDCADARRCTQPHRALRVRVGRCRRPRQTLHGARLRRRTDLLVTTLWTKPGIAVANIGVGTGHLARSIAPANRTPNALGVSATRLIDIIGNDPSSEPRSGGNQPNRFAGWTNSRSGESSSA